MSTVIISVVSAVVGAMVGALANAALNARARRAERREKLDFRVVGHHYGWEPTDEEMRDRFPDFVGPGALRLEWRAQLRNRGAHAATVRNLRWWPRDEWERSFYYWYLESIMELVRVGEEGLGKPMEEGEEGDVFTIPAGSFATLRFEGLFLVLPGERQGRPEGCAPRLAASCRGARDYFETGDEPLTRKEKLLFATVMVRSLIETGPLDYASGSAVLASSPQTPTTPHASEKSEVCSGTTVKSPSLCCSPRRLQKDPTGP
jgi:hypothetical protein